MEPSRKFFMVIAVLLVLVATTEVVSVQARSCHTASTRFSGLCFQESNCATICILEGFVGGVCQGLKRRCMCTTTC
ncbi:unnamed protein product [Alopecurus aequalis]